MADDDSVILTMVGRLLDARYEILGHASDGLSLVDQAMRHLPDVVVTDISISKLDGIEATRLICDSSEIVTVVVLSVHADPAYVEAAFDAGAHAYVLKVAATQELIPVHSWRLRAA